MFFKRTTTLFDTQLDALAQKAVMAAEAVVEMIHHPQSAPEHAKAVGELEHSADRIVRDTVSLQTSNLGAVERADLLNLLEGVDDIVDAADAIAQRVWLHQVPGPTEEAKALAQVFLQSAKGVQRVIRALRTMGGAHEVLDLCVELNRLERQGDELYRQSMLALFSGKYDAMHIARWKDVYERLERGVNKCEDVAKIVEGLVQAIA